VSRWIRGALATRLGRWSIVATLATGALLGVPAIAGAAPDPHFSALPASVNTQLSVARDGLGVAPLPGGKALIVGGFNAGGPQTTADIFDTATDTFTALSSSLNVARSSPAVAPLPGGKVLIAGGSTTGGTDVRTAELFDSATGTFTELPAAGNTELVVARGAAAAAPLPDGRVLIAGGFDGTNFLQSAELFDPASNTFSLLPASGNTELQTARSNFVAVAMQSGKVLIAGGIDAARNPLSSAETFDPASETFSALPASGATQLQTARVAPAGAELPDGRVLIAGGDISGSGSVTAADVLASAEVFDPASGSFTALPASGATQLQVPRAYMAATTLGNGQIIFVGGAGPDYLASAELATLPPSCLPSSASMGAGAAHVQVALHCSGPALTYTIVSGPAHGTLGAIDQTGGTVTYTPNPGFSGQDSFTYGATNVAGPSNAVAVTISVAAPPPSASLGNVTVRGATASVPIACHGASDATCTGTVTFTTKVTSVGSAIIRVATPAAARRRPKPRTTTVTVATAGFSVPAGGQATVRITLNATGKRLLARFYQLPTRMRVTGAAAITRSVRFHYSVIDASISYSFVHSSSGVTTVSTLTPTTLPHLAHVQLVCRGPGCPFAKRVLVAHSRRLPLAGQFHGARLHTGAVVSLTVTAPLSVGQVSTFTMLRRGPRLTVSCLPPGAHRPVACA
jgi:hypothetical protein